MDDSDRPTDETEGLEKRTWTMPEPVFQSTRGFTPGEKDVDPELDIPTEPIGFKKDVDSALGSSSQSVRVKEETRGNRHQKKKGGCAKFFTLLALLVGLIVGLGILGLIYLLFYYRPSSTVF